MSSSDAIYVALGLKTVDDTQGVVVLGLDTTREGCRAKLARADGSVQHKEVFHLGSWDRLKEWLTERGVPDDRVAMICLGVMQVVNDIVS